MFLKLVDFVFKPALAYAHCDVPCGIYETNTLLMAAHTVERMVEVIEQLPKEKNDKDHNTFVRCVVVKEKHAQICKEQLLILWADFFKEEHLAMFPDIHEKFWKAAKLCSDNKQDISMEKAEALEKICHEISDMVEKAKVEPKEDHQGVISDNPEAPKKKLLSK